MARRGAPRDTKERSFVESTVAEIHAYPLRPEGFVEPLFRGRESDKEIAEHLAASGWLWRASKQMPGTGGTAHRRERKVKIERRHDGRIVLVREKDNHARVRRCRYGQRKTVVRRVIGRWREVRNWWEDSGGTDRYLYRLLLGDGSVVDLARAKRGGWRLVGVVD